MISTAIRLKRLLSIQRSFSNTSFSHCTIRRKDVIKPLASLITSKQCGESSGQCDEQAIFIRLVAIGSRINQEAMKATLEDELTSEPMALFKDDIMRKLDKASLLKCILGEEIIITSNSAVRLLST